MDVHFHTDAAGFLTVADETLSADPVRFSVIATVAARTAERQAEGSFEARGPHWFATIGHPSSLVGVAMRTMPDPPHAAFVSTMPDDAARALAAALLARDEILEACNGDLTIGALVLDAMGEASGRSVRVAMHTRLFELREVRWPPEVAGELRHATPQDVPLLQRWMADFHRDADAQAGRTEGHHVPLDPDRLTRRLEHLWLRWVDGEPVHLTGVNPPAMGAVRLGPVFTPAEHRGRGYAAHTVATLSQRLLDDGLRPCLYTDQANPVSNQVYERVGYEAVCDEGNLVLTPA